MILLLLVAAAFGQSELPEAAGRDTVIRICGNCHHPRILIGRELSEDAWMQVVGEMVRRGARGSDTELEDIVQYLAKNIKASPVNVNKAGADELARSLQISTGEAESIVGARKKAEFRRLEDLKKVVEPRKIERMRHRIEF